MPKISVVIPTYNQAKYLNQSIESVLNQTLDDFELIIVNDGSIDSTPQILEGVNDKRVKVFHQQNRGQCSAMNFGFKEASGEYLTWLASDNLFEPCFLEKASLFLEQKPDISLVYSSFKNIDSNGKFINYTFLEPYYQGLLLVNPGSVGMAFLYRKTVMEKIGSYNGLIDDLDYWLRAARHFKFAFLPEILGQNRKHLEMKTTKNREVLLKKVDELVNNELDASVNTPDPCLIENITNLARKINEFVRALKCRIDSKKQNLTIAIVGQKPICDYISAILEIQGFNVCVLTLSQSTESDLNYLYLPLDVETELELKRLPRNIISLESVHTSSFGMDF